MISTDGPTFFTPSGVSVCIVMYLHMQNQRNKMDTLGTTENEHARPASISNPWGCRGAYLTKVSKLTPPYMLHKGATHNNNNNNNNNNDNNDSHIKSHVRPGDRCHRRRQAAASGERAAATDYATHRA